MQWGQTQTRGVIWRAHADWTRVDWAESLSDYAATPQTCHCSYFLELRLHFPWNPLTSWPKKASKVFLRSAAADYGDCASWKKKHVYTWEEEKASRRNWSWWWYNSVMLNHTVDASCHGLRTCTQISLTWSHPIGWGILIPIIVSLWGKIFFLSNTSQSISDSSNLPLDAAVTQVGKNSWDCYEATRNALSLVSWSGWLYDGKSSSIHTPVPNLHHPPEKPIFKKTTW